MPFQELKTDWKLLKKMLKADLNCQNNIKTAVPSGLARIVSTIPHIRLSKLFEQVEGNDFFTMVGNFSKRIWLRGDFYEKNQLLEKLALHLQNYQTKEFGVPVLLQNK